eukprot:TRINITY_DN2097_c0_g1_i7.p1 TRINITY_DN2097_c0_g1~~TRINITY_DN2097_c0_g1_i7.p1  ORF type:complete len:983 (+),score=295.76 TRINITY_DN2097_c0_g1_i7:105-3053(+)
MEASSMQWSLGSNLLHLECLKSPRLESLDYSLITIEWNWERCVGEDVVETMSHGVLEKIKCQKGAPPPTPSADFEETWKESMIVFPSSAFFRVLSQGDMGEYQLRVSVFVYDTPDLDEIEDVPVLGEDLEGEEVEDEMEDKMKKGLESSWVDMSFFRDSFGLRRSSHLREIAVFLLGRYEMDEIKGNLSFGPSVCLPFTLPSRVGWSGSRWHLHLVVDCELQLLKILPESITSSSLESEWESVAFARPDEASISNQWMSFGFSDEDEDADEIVLDSGSEPDSELESRGLLAKEGHRNGDQRTHSQREKRRSAEESTLLIIRPEDIIRDDYDVPFGLEECLLEVEMKGEDGSIELHDLKEYPFSDEIEDFKKSQYYMIHGKIAKIGRPVNIMLARIRPYDVVHDRRRVHEIVNMRSSAGDEGILSLEELIVLRTLILAFTRTRDGYTASIRLDLKRRFGHLNVEYEEQRERIEYMTALEWTNVESQTAEEREDDVSDQTQRASEDKYRAVKIGAAAVGAGALFFLTGGLLSPVIGTALHALGAGAAISTVTGATGVSGTLLISGAFAAGGAAFASKKMAILTKGLDEFSFQPLCERGIGQSHCFTICIDGWKSLREPFSWERICHRAGLLDIPRRNDDESVDDLQLENEILQLTWETEHLLNLGKALEDLQKNMISSLGRTMAVRLLVPVLAWPATVFGLASGIDSPWNMVMDRSLKAGRALGRCLFRGILGRRPTTLIGTSMGARVIYFSLLELQRLLKKYVKKQSSKSKKQSSSKSSSKSAPVDHVAPPTYVKDCIENVVLFGAPVPGDPKLWRQIRSLVQGRLINVHARSDFILRLVFRTVEISKVLSPVAGVLGVDLADVENVDASDVITSHLDYQKPEIIQKILRDLKIKDPNFMCSAIEKEYTRVAPSTSDVASPGDAVQAEVMEGDSEEQTSAIREEESMEKPEEKERKETKDKPLIPPLRGTNIRNPRGGINGEA